VDDNESDNFLHERVLKKADIAVSIYFALNGRAALNLLTGNSREGSPPVEPIRPDLIFLDLNMPVMDGWEFLEEYRKLGFDQKKNIVIVMLTTSINPADKLRAARYVENDCFQYKPLTLKMISVLMERYFPEAHFPPIR
jgi:CheY-like chemotaxis protein